VETARVLFGLAAAVLVPWSLGLHRARPGTAVLFTLVYGGFAIAPYRGDAKPDAGLACAALLSLAGALWCSSPLTPSPGFSLTLPLSSGTVTRTRWLGAAAFSAAVALSVWAAGAWLIARAAALLTSDRVCVLVSALLISVVGGGSLAQTATGPVRREIEALPLGPQRDAALEFMSGSRAIGLLERGLLFCFFAAGQPEAAALVLAAKSLARVPTAEHGKQASEYFLVGTLASVIASSAMSMAARSAMGLSAL
jgi:hypothetical protein